MNTHHSSLRFRRLTVLLAVGAGMLAPGALADGNNPAYSPRQNSPAAREDARLRGADKNNESRLVLSQARFAADLRGRDVHNSRGEKIGSVNDVVIDLNSGRAPYVIVQSGGVLGMGARERAVPMGALQPRLADGKSDGYTLDVSNELWEQAPRLERDRLTDLENEINGRNLHHIYGQVWPADEPVAETANPASPGVNPPDRGRKETGDARTVKGTQGELEKHARGQQLVLASELTGKALVIRATDREAGSIDEIVLAREGSRAAILLDPAGTLSRDGRKYVIPFGRVIREGGGRYVTDLRPEDFEATIELDGDESNLAPGAVRLWPTPDERARTGR